MKAGDKVRLKSMSECEKIEEDLGFDETVGTDPDMEEWFGEVVTVHSTWGYYFFIIEDEEEFLWNNLWVAEQLIEDQPVDDTITFVVDDDYSAPTKMYLKATKLAIDVMERIRVENPEFWDVLKSSGARDNFFREILADEEKMWEQEDFNWEFCGFHSFFEWTDSVCGGMYWVAMSKKFGVPKNKPSTYHFIDTSINLDQICSDTIKDGKTSFVVEGGDRLYVGWIKRDLSYSPETPPLLRVISGYALTVCEIHPSEKSVWESYLQDLATEYSKDLKKRDEFIKDRDREKGDNRFTVVSW